MMPARPVGQPPEVDGRAPHSLVGVVFGVSMHQMAVMFRQLATMIDGGLTSAKALDTLSQHTGGHFGRALAVMAQRLHDGWMLHKVLALYPEYFSELVICLVEAGETGGQLDIRLREIADYLEQSYEIRQRMISQAVYPVLILHAAIFIPPLFVWVTLGGKAYAMTVLPRLAVMYALFAIFFVCARLMSVPIVKLVTDTFTSNFPVVGSVVRNGAMMRILRALGDLLEAGLPVTRALEVAARAGGNEAIARRLLAVMPSLDTGIPLSLALGKSGVMPPMAQQMLVTGEASGSIGHSLKKAADIIKIDFDNAMRRVTALIPALLTLAVAGMVGYQYISFFSSYFNQINEIMP